jgi:TolA-binding protein
LLRAKPGAMRASSAEGMPGKDPAATKPVAASAPSALSEPHAAADERKAASRDDPMMSGPSEKTLAPAAESDGDGRLAASGNPSDEDALDEAFERGMKNFRAGNHAEAQRDFAAVGGSHNKGAASALLYHARSVRAAAGCKEAVTHYGKVVQRFGNAGIGADATFEQADCYQQLGDRGRARQLLLALAENPEYQARASAELNRGGEAASTGGNAVLAPRKAAASPPPATQERAKAAPNRFDSSY